MFLKQHKGKPAKRIKLWQSAIACHPGFSRHQALHAHNDKNSGVTHSDIPSLHQMRNLAGGLAMVNIWITNHPTWLSIARIVSVSSVPSVRRACRNTLHGTGKGGSQATNFTADAREARISDAFSQADLESLWHCAALQQSVTQLRVEQQGHVVQLDALRRENSRLKEVQVQGAASGKLPAIIE